jgi:hypothetical protein
MRTPPLAGRDTYLDSPSDPSRANRLRSGFLVVLVGVVHHALIVRLARTRQISKR